MKYNKQKLRDRERKTNNKKNHQLFIKKKRTNKQVYMNLVYALAIPIPSFIISVIYLTIAYFKIYNEDEEKLVEKEEGADNEDGEDALETSVGAANSGNITPGSEAFREDLASFGHELKVAMVDDISRESLDGIPNSFSG